MRRGLFLYIACVIYNYSVIYGPETGSSHEQVIKINDQFHWSEVSTVLAQISYDFIGCGVSEIRDDEDL